MSASSSSDEDGDHHDSSAGMPLAADASRTLARMRRSEARDQARREAARKADILRRKRKAQNNVYARLAFAHPDDDNYYEHLPMRPGIDMLKWLAPIHEEVIAGRKHRRPGLDAVKINIPETVVYSERYAGVAEMWLSTSARDGCVVSRRLTGKWEQRFAARTASRLDAAAAVAASSSSGQEPDTSERRAAAVLKISHWRNGSTMSNISRIVPEYSLTAALKAPTPNAGMACVQGFVHSRGQHASVYRIVWTDRKPPTGWCIGSERYFSEQEPSALSAPTGPRSGATVDDFLSSTHLASLENQGADSDLPVTVFELHMKAIAEPVAETRKLVQFLERVKTDAGHLKFEQMVVDFARDRHQAWVFLQVKAFRVTPSTMERCRQYSVAHRVSHVCVCGFGTCVCVLRCVCVRAYVCVRTCLTEAALCVCISVFGGLNPCVCVSRATWTVMTTRCAQRHLSASVCCCSIRPPVSFSVLTPRRRLLRPRLATHPHTHTTLVRTIHIYTTTRR